MLDIHVCFQGSISDDEVDGDNEPLPDFLLPEYSQKDKVCGKFDDRGWNKVF